MYTCTHFGIKELVDKETYSIRGEKAWALLDERALRTLDKLRETFGSTIVNDWSWGGSNQWRGLRTDKSKYYSPYSQHSFGRAFDCIFKHHTAEEVRNYIKENRDEFPYITSMEDGVSWLHFDVRNSKFITFPGPISK